MASTEEEPPNAATIEITEEEEGARVELEDFFFMKIGAALPLKQQSSNFDLEDPPTQALAVSENPQAVFVAHSEGFYVVKTLDAIEAAKSIKEKKVSSSIQELSVVDVRIGRVRILDVSKDGSTLAAIVGGHIQFFSVTSLLNKEHEPLHSCSIDEPSLVKDFRWRKKRKSSFLVISNDGLLYHGDLDNPLKEMMQNVDAVDWGPGGNFIAVAKGTSLSIFSSRFKERFTLLIPYTSFTTDTDPKGIIRVDSIKWLRPDCLVLGCMQITEDGREDGYFIQMISSKDGKISEASSKPVALYFDGAFAGINDDILPFGRGPHLFLNYLEHCGRELALVANRKNTEEHMILFGWSLDEHKEAAFIELCQEDRWLPRVGLQDNGDDNLIMGFAVDKVSLHEKFNVTVGVEQKELSPCCILLCLTLDGKLLMFYLADVTEYQDSPKIVSVISDEEEDSTEAIPLACDSSKVSSRFEEHGVEETELHAKSPKTSQEELEGKGTGDILKEHEPQVNELKDSSRSRLRFDDSSNKEMSNSFKMSFPSAGENQDRSKSLTAKNVVRTPSDVPPPIDKQPNAMVAPQSLISGRQSSNLEKSSEQSPLFSGSDSLFRDSRKFETQKPAFAPSGLFLNNSSTANTPSIFKSKLKESLGNDEASHEVPRNFQGDRSASPFSHSSHKLSSSDEFNSRLSSAEVNRVKTSGSQTGNTVNITGPQRSLDRQHDTILNMKDSTAPAEFATNTSARSIPIGGQRMSAGLGKFATEPATRSVQVSSYQGSMHQNPQESKAQSSQGNSRSPQVSYGMASEQDFSKHFGNVNEMAKELDTLLSCIEGEGGFRDACIIFQKDSVSEIEQGLENLAERCRDWKIKMEDQFEGVQHLLDQTVQVLARKVYIQGIVKQAYDSQYWELWDRQKLTPELELKRRQILKVNQELAHQLIELERHFNTLELNKFGVPTARRVFHSGSKPSRDGQAFNRLYNTMTSQLEAAEKLSECLTKQMAVLNIESASTKQKFVARELFDSIGLAYDGDSFKSPSAKKVVHSPESVKKLALSSAGAVIEQSRRNPSSVVKNFETETARRRVSLDRSWAGFEPPKTTVKRILLQEERPRLTANEFSLASNKEGSQKRSAIAPLKDNKSPPPSFQSRTNKDETNRFQLTAHQDIQDKGSQQSSTISFKRINDLSGKSQSSNMKSSTMQGTQSSNLISSTSAVDSSLSPHEVRNNKAGSFGLVSDKLSSGMSRADRSDHSKVQPIQFSTVPPSLPTESSVNQTSSMTKVLQSPKKSSQEMSVNLESSLNPENTFQTKSAFGSLNYREASQDSSVSVSMKSQNSPFMLSASSTPNFLKKSSQPEAAKETQSGSSLFPPVTVSPSVPFPSPPIKASTFGSSVPLSIPPSAPSSSPLTKAEITAKPSTDVKVPSVSTYSFSSPLTTSEITTKPSTDVKVPSVSTYSSSAHSTPALVSPSPFSLQATTQQSTPSTSSTTMNVKSQVQSTELKPATPLEEPKPTVVESNIKFDFNTPQALPPQAGPVSVAPSPSADISPTPVTIDTTNGSTDLAATQEDEMEEEAFDTSADLGLGSLSGFGLGSAPTSAAPKPNPFGGSAPTEAAPKPNPFGVSFQNPATNPTNSPFKLSVPSGELFRPASFSLQPTQPSQPASQSVFSGGFSAPAPTSGFGRPAQMGPGQQALGSVLGSFGQSRQLGTGSPGTGFPSPGGAFGFASGIHTPPSGGFANAAPSGGGFANAAPSGGGFAAVAGGGGGFAAAGSGGGGFAAAGSGGGGFAAAGGGGGGFAAAPSSGGFAAAPSSGGGFGGFSNPQGGGGFAGFGSSNTGGSDKPPQFMQMRK